MRLHVGQSTHVGQTRSANEDSFLSEESEGLFAVADGMGGHRAGDVASATAIETVKVRREAGEGLVDAIQDANAAVWEKAQANPDMRGMGTTVTAVLVDGVTAHIGHVGDSRAYLWRDGQLTQVTDDHSLVEELVREGRLTRDEAAVHPQRSIITRALGVDAEVDVDTYEIDLRPGDRLLVCSDGLTSMVRDSGIVDLLRSETDAQGAADALVEAANDAGGEDNVTVLVIDVEGEDDADDAEAGQASRAVADLDDRERTGEWAAPPELLQDEAEDDGEATEHPAHAGPARWKRFLFWAVPVIVLAGVTVLVLGWYARRTYFVGIDQKQVALYKGVPGGFLGWDPTVENRTSIPADDLSQQMAEDLQDGHRFSSRSAAEAFIRRLRREVTSTTTTEPSSSTTLPSSSTTGQAAGPIRAP